ncbi:LAME_0A02410g1_1 [Lachancea meyersii CBS 8951]|uniref:LAME_0A02410g1_1 n=1 Tax=Lachancea meyersii CBS 8951 TaxID=1266667 RepID=A0A1G4IMM2_9SACH|nr:LAME_0A02410g1_1 [Lachancea meyersii CBS 8951]
MVAQQSSNPLFGTRDIIVEYQRGVTVLGYPVFSPNLLLRGIDPPQFQLAGPDGQTAQKGEIKPGGGLWPLDLDSQSRDYKWFVSMDHANRFQTDDQGWSYSWRFRSNHWRASKGFVRKRFWVRLRERSPELTAAEPDSSSEGGVEVMDHSNNNADKEPQATNDEQSSSSAQDPFANLLIQLSKPSLDRQKADAVLTYISELSAGEKRQLMEPDSPDLKQILEQFQFEKSRQMLMDKLLPATST